jgi:CubicO group peptidase (beta-lactamase class C family)
MTATHQMQFENFVSEVMTVYHAQGMGIVGFDKETLLYEHYSGFRDVAQALPITRDTVFGIASISKSFTTLALMQLVAKGVITLEAKVNRYLPEILLPEAQMPTVAQLLSHAGGFLPQERFLMSDVLTAMGVAPEMEPAFYAPLAEKGLTMIVERINAMRDFTGLPGQYHSYSNFSFGLITAIVQRFGGAPDYATYMQQHIFEPLGLENTFVAFNQTASCANITKLYENVLGHLNTMDDYRDQGFVLLGGGAIKSTLNDLMAYTRLYLNEGKHGQQQFIASDLINGMSLPYVHPKPYEGYGYGLVSGQFSGIDYAGHSGGLTGVSSFFGFSRQTGKGVVVLCNTSDVPATAVGIAALKMMNGIEPDWQLAHFERSIWSAAIVESTVGVYESEEGARVVLSAGNGTVIWNQGDETLVVMPVSDSAVVVYNKLIWSYAPIIRDEAGNAVAVYSGSRMIRKRC